ncbi:MAG: inositol monophosphatase family protein [Verrucomicrobiota bacterium]
MSFSDNDLKTLHGLAVRTAERAGAHVHSRVDNHGGAQAKEGGDTLASQIVTEVDHESEDLILGDLANSIDAHELGLLTEESEDDQSRHERSAFWCVDPIDGTLPFTEGIPGYSVSIALVSRTGTPLIGVIHDPVEQVTYHAFRGGGAFRDGVRIQSHADSRDHPLTWAMDRSMTTSPRFPSALKAMEFFVERAGFPGLEILDHAGSVLNACWVTDHDPALYFKFPKKSRGGGSVWDFAATACLASEWGQPATDIHGDPLDLNPAGCTFMNEKGVVYGSNEELRELAYQLYRSQPD